jgi:hypothetical protein
MSLFPSAFRGQALMALSFLLAISTWVNAQGDPPQKQTEPSETAKKVARLTAALRDPNRRVRIAAADALGRGGSISAEILAALKTAAKDEDASVRRAAKEACHLLLTGATKEDLPALLAAVKDAEPFMHLPATRALGKVGSISAETVAALKVAAEGKEGVRWEEVRRASYSLFGKATKEDVPALAGALKDTELFIRWPAARALSKIGSVSVSPDAVAALKAAAEEDDVEVRLAWERIPPSMVMLALEPPLVEGYLRKGQLAAGEAALLERLKHSPKDDQARFGLGVLRFIRGVERLGQSLRKYGTRSENTNIPFLRLPVPKNPDPAPISYAAFRRVLADFHRDLSAAEATLADVTDEKVKLPLRLALIRLDLVGDGKADEKFIGILEKIMQRREFSFLESNPDFLVGFDRGDVAWLRAYCHLLMAMLDVYLALDTEELFNASAGELFAKPESPFRGADEERQKKIAATASAIAVKEPARLGQFRKHLIKVAQLNRETWKYIRAETDDDHEWLPNPKQKGVLGLPVEDRMIDGWLAMVAELEALLEGKRKIPVEKDGKGLNLKTLFDDPPEKFVSENFPRTLPDKYWSDAEDVNINVLFGVFVLFGDPTAVAYYTVWFN